MPMTQPVGAITIRENLQVAFMGVQGIRRLKWNLRSEHSDLKFCHFLRSCIWRMFGVGIGVWVYL